MSEQQGPNMADIAQQSRAQQSMSSSTEGGQADNVSYLLDHVQAVYNGFKPQAFLQKKMPGFISAKPSGVKQWLERLGIRAKAQFTTAVAGLGQAMKSNGGIIGSSSMSAGQVFSRSPDITPQNQQLQHDLAKQNRGDGMGR